MTMARGRPPSTQPYAVSFRTYTSEEIRKLSVKEITQSQFFTEIGTPVSGGLYDSALGPCEKSDVCSTCLLSPLHCPGHLGHITLPLPVFNPLYMRLIVQLLHGSCLKCHHLAASPSSISMFLSRMGLLENGRVDLLDHISEEKVKLLVSDDTGRAPAEGAGRHVGGDSPEELLEDLLGLSARDLSKEDSSTSDRVVSSFKNQFIEEFIRDHLSKKGKKCRRCKGPLHAVKLENNIRILTKGDEGGIVTTVTISSQEAREHIRRIYVNEKHIVSRLYGMLKETGDTSRSDASPVDQFFIEVLPVIPARFRPIAGAGDSLFSNFESQGLAVIVVICNQLRQLILAINKPTNESQPVTATAATASSSSSSNLSLPEQLQRTWYELQMAVNCIVDSDLDKLKKFNQKKGIKQTLERKEGIFRKYMMGKRVNYAARSVISPDPYINSDQIGIPSIIAKKLTYPEPVTDRNILEMQQAVKNGPNIHPGAVAVEIAPGKILRLNPTDQIARDAVANRLLVPNNPSENTPAQKKVHRHIRNGDIVLLNRQPTLHKPGIMAHKVRILSGEKTLRLHYSACKTYNADFDGDEMNVHFPQNEMGRAEAIIIANTSEQYLVPKDGTPLGGLIQDHMIAGVHMTVRGRFFTWSQYQQLVYSALTDKTSAVKLLPPSIIKPALLWSGKQVVSTVLLNIFPEDKQPLNFVGRTKVKDKSWVSSKSRECSTGGVIEGTDMSEAQVVIRQGELLCGLLDKENYGPTPYGMVHCCYELYGGQVGVAILSCLGRLFTSFLQQIMGFSLGIKDIIILPKADKVRQKLLRAAPAIGADGTARALDLITADNQQEMKEEFEAAHRGSSHKTIADIDLVVKGCTDKLSEDVSNACLPKGLLMKFPENNLQTMILSGAKGSMVNALQISCLLGQIELEGRRPPLMISGKSLPSFTAYDPSLRAGGYVAGRFLTGIRPQEYFFHCMAGREGLIDTAVKTSRSGYLQRCIIKHLEGLVVNYDLTVRDSDSSVIQFSYGEDGLDISQTPFLKKEHFGFFMENEDAERYSKDKEQRPLHTDPHKADRIFKQVRKWRRRKEGHLHHRSGFVAFTEGKVEPLVQQAQRIAPTEPIADHYRKAKLALVKQWRECTDKESFEKPCKGSPDPAHCQLQPNQIFGAVSERMHEVIEGYLRNEFPSLHTRQRWSKESFKQLIYQKYRRSLCEPGEAVGLLAAQSIGEPSTQMTLNTFHFAGRGEMNVTLGIPRLREILMVASKNIKTPSMTVPVIQHHRAERKAKKLCQRLTKVVLSNVLEDMNVWESYRIQEYGAHCSIYRVRLGLLSKEDYETNISLNPSTVLRFVEKKFFSLLSHILQRKIRDINNTRVLKSSQVKEGKQAAAENDEGPEGDVTMEQQSDDEADVDREDARKAAKTDDYEDELMDDALVEPGEEAGHEEEEPMTTQDRETEQMTTPLKNKGTVSDADKRKRINGVLESFDLIKSYNFDQSHELWCEFVIEIPLMDSGRPDVTLLISDLAGRAIVHHAPGIDRCILAEDVGVKLIQTEGVNLKQMYHFDKIVDINKLYTNDVHAMAATFGIEAACRVLIKEITDVFKVYGIAVDPRHLSLIADYMMYDGYYKPFSRGGLETNPSMLQKMTFESCMSVLRKATVQGTQDNLQSPSARLVLGRVVSGGTGFFDVFPKVV